MGKSFLILLFNLISIIMALFAFFMAIGMLFAANVNNFWSFLVMFVSGLLCLKFVQSGLNAIIRRKINPLVYVFVAITLFFSGLLIGLGTEEQAAAREVKEKQEDLVAAQVEADKLQAKAEKQAAKQKAEAESKAARDRESATSKATLVTTCQLAIKPQLNNPKSMDIDYRQTALGETSDGQLGVKMYYYAENSFGATPLNVAVCLFDADGNLVEYKQAQ